MLAAHGSKHSGIVKVCASWALRLWAEGVMVNEVMDNTNMKTLGDKTFIFDHCGAFDIKNGDATIELGSRFEPWSDCSKFLNWLGLLRMEGFYIVIVDNISETKGAKSPYLSPESCFNTSVLRLGLSALALLSSLALVSF